MIVICKLALKNKKAGFNLFEYILLRGFKPIPVSSFFDDFWPKMLTLCTRFHIFQGNPGEMGGIIIYNLTRQNAMMNASAVHTAAAV